MTKQTLEQRFTKLEAKVDKLRDEVRSARNGAARSWQRAVERFSGDADLQAVFASAMKLREADRKRTRKGHRKRTTKE